LEDYVPGSSAIFRRNDNYWGKDPFYPQNQLPYADKLKMLIITDSSTQMAAVRTGKLDIVGGLSIDDEKSFASTNPKMGWHSEQATSPFMIYVRCDLPPTNDVKVRRALHMGVDLQGIVKDYYSGNALFYWWPVPNWGVFKGAYTPFEELPQSIKELFVYNPDQAKKLLAEAGYPNGFKISILVSATPSKNVDFLSLIKDYWSKIGVDLQIDAKEYSVVESIWTAKTYTGMCYHWNSSITLPRKALETKKGSPYNYGMISDPYNDERRDKIWVFENMKNFELQNRLTKEMALHYLEQCYSIQTPSELFFTGWHPWVKGYGGAESVGYGNYYNWAKYVWIDEALKTSMGY
jgi:peptide/nickel transport system substrate-binding protein